MELLSHSKYTLRRKLSDFEGNNVYAKYSTFMVGPESDGYRLTIGEYSGDAGDSLTRYNGQTFVTKDCDRRSCSAISVVP